MKLILTILGIICFVVDAFKAWVFPASRINFFALGAAQRVLDPGRVAAADGAGRQRAGIA